MGAELHGIIRLGHDVTAGSSSAVEQSRASRTIVENADRISSPHLLGGGVQGPGEDRQRRLVHGHGHHALLSSKRSPSSSTVADQPAGTRLVAVASSTTAGPVRR
jgi:hypothetical protein